LIAALNFLSIRSPQNAAILNTFKRLSSELLITTTRSIGRSAGPRVTQDQQGLTVVTHEPKFDVVYLTYNAPVAPDHWLRLQ